MALDCDTRILKNDALRLVDLHGTAATATAASAYVRHQFGSESIKQFYFPPTNYTYSLHTWFTFSLLVAPGGGDEYRDFLFTHLLPADGSFVTLEEMSALALEVAPRT